MKKILIIPHHPHMLHLKIRLVELAHGLSANAEVNLLHWSSSDNGGSFFQRIRDAFRDLFRKNKIYKQGDLMVAQFPIIRRPLAIARIFNSFWLNRFITRNRFDIVVNGSYYMFSIPRMHSYVYVFDLADLPAGVGSAVFDEFEEKTVVRESQKADHVTVVSQGLAEYMKSRFDCAAECVPNGVYLENVRSVDKTRSARVRNRYNLDDKWVIGYIGFIGSWVDVETVVAAFRIAKKKIPDAMLMWIGPAPNLGQLRVKYAQDGVIFTGPVDDIDAYFHAVDVGILSHEKTYYQDVAFHIKMIEFTAARKIVISSPLEEVKRIALPNVIVADLTISAWADAIEKAHDIKWDNSWNHIVDAYDWEKIGKRFLSLIDKKPYE